MKTNLTTKQVKKIQNGKLAIYKDIDTADAREYLFNVLDWLFPKDPSSISAKKTEIREYVYLHLSKDISNYWHGTLNNANIPTLPLSRIMYAYNPEQFKPISMPCTEEQWNNDLKPIVEVFWIDCSGVFGWLEHHVLTNNYNLSNEIGNIVTHTKKHGKLLPTYSPAEFLEACGIVRVDKVEDNAMVQETFKIYYNGICIFELGNFAKVIKSAELIKAEEELEQAKKRVETLNGKESDQYVFVVQNKGTLMIHGSFVTKDKAYKYINGNTDTYHILEIKLD